MILDLHTEAMRIHAENRFVPLALVQQILEKGAEIATAEITKEISTMRTEMNAKRDKIERGTGHSWANLIL